MQLLVQRLEPTPEDQSCYSDDDDDDCEDDDYDADFCRAGPSLNSILLLVRNLEPPLTRPVRLESDVPVRIYARNSICCDLGTDRKSVV